MSSPADDRATDPTSLCPILFAKTPTKKGSIQSSENLKQNDLLDAGRKQKHTYFSFRIKHKETFFATLSAECFTVYTFVGLQV